MRLGRFVQGQRPRSPEGTNICGVLVRAAPGTAEAVRRRLAAMAGVVVHQAGSDGRLVLTVEDTESEWAGQILTRLPTVEGVMSTSLVYHHCEAGDLDKELVR